MNARLHACHLRLRLRRLKISVLRSVNGSRRFTGLIPLVSFLPLMSMYPLLTQSKSQFIRSIPGMACNRDLNGIIASTLHAGNQIIVWQTIYAADKKGSPRKRRPDCRAVCPKREAYALCACPCTRETVFHTFTPEAPPQYPEKTWLSPSGSSPGTARYPPF